jgi:hypothetical protein
LTPRVLNFKKWLLNPADEGEGTSEYESPSTDPTTTTSSSGQTLPSDIIRLSNTCLIAGYPDVAVTIDDLKKHLPTVDRGYYLANLFFQHAGWFYRPLSEDEFISRIFSNVYGLVDTRDKPQDIQASSRHTPHELALLFMVLSVGAAVDLDQIHDNEEKENYRILSMASMRLGRSVEGASIELVQTLNLIVYGWLVHSFSTIIASHHYQRAVGAPSYRS